MKRRSPAAMIAALPIRRKLSGIVTLATVCALLLACGAFIVYDFYSVRRATARDLETLAAVVASNSAAALMFDDAPACAEILSGLRARSSIVAAAIYRGNGRVFVRYGRGGIPATASNGDDVFIGDNGIRVFRRIEFRGEAIGMLYVASDLRELQRRLRTQIVVAALILALALLVALAMAARLQSLVTRPLLELAATAQRVTREKDYSVRFQERDRPVRDETGAVISAFNEMLGQIESRDDALGRSRDALEGQVLQRTAELTSANAELIIAKRAAESVAAMNAQLARESALILNSATDGILGVDVDNRAIFLNPAGERILGMTLQEMRGKTVHEAFHHSRPDGTPWAESECANTQTMRRGGFVPLLDDTFWRPDGTSFPVEYSSKPMVGDDGAQLGAVMIFRDVTERQVVERLKSEFVSTFSHELRTPLTSIRGALGLLSSGLLGSVGEKGQRMLEMAVTNTDRLVRLINDILDLERIESGKVKLARGPVDANAIMLQTVGGLRAIADEAGVAVVIVPATAFVWGDSDRIIQTLTNLVGNAIKFSPAGTTVIVSGSRVEGDFAFCVSDQGRGVPEEKRKTIFERFNQVDASDSRDKGGSGLGLAICQSIVDAHGGEIWVEPNQPAGSRFCFTIPLATPLQLGASEAESVASTPPESVEVARAPLVDRVFHEGHPTAAEAGNTSVRHVLVIDDERDIRDVISASLQLSEGWTVVTANGGTAGAALAQTSAPDAILLDIMMPELDGPGTLRALRAQVANRSTPVIFLTAKVQAAERQKFMQLGVRGIISKPFDPLTLGQQIKDLLWWT